MNSRKRAAKSEKVVVMRFYLVRVAHRLVRRHSLVTVLKNYFCCVAQSHESVTSSPVLIVGIPKIFGAGGGTL